MIQSNHQIARRRRRLGVIATGTLCLVTGGADAAPKANKKETPAASSDMAKAVRMPRGSYLRKPVHSIGQLVKQFANDPLIVERYSRVFKMSPQTIKSALQEMRLVPLKKDMVMNVYYVRPGENLGYRVRRVKKGTPVFVLPDGTPALVQACGNPLRHTLAAQKLKNIPDFRVDEPLDALPSEQLTAQPLPEEQSVTRMAASVATAPPMVTATPASELEADAELVVVAGATAGANPADFIEDIGALPLGFLAAGGGAASGLLSSLLAAGGAAALGGWVANTGGRTSENPTNPVNPINPGNPGTPGNPGNPGNPGTPGSPPPTGGPNPPGLVPEWNTTGLFLFAMAGAGVPAYFRRRRSIAAK